MDRKLVKVLRHSARSLGLDMDSQGFILIQDLLDHDLFRDLDDQKLLEIVNCDKKSRLQVCGDKIRAAQGHSISLNISYPEYTNTVLPLFHGTFRNKLEEITRSGLSRMNRNYIHLTNDLNAVSGVRSNCEIFIYINIELSMNDDIVFYQSSNGVILTRGIDGVIPIKYFLKITTREGQEYDLQDKRFIDIL